jgi:ankyrin repeat protein
MGCNNSKRKKIRIDYIVKSIKHCIDSENCSIMVSRLKTYCLMTKQDVLDVIDKQILIFKSIELNLLGYAVWRGRAVSFLYILEHLKASFPVMEQNFANKGLCSLNIICEKGYLDLLKKYLTYYLAYKNRLSVNENNSSVKTQTHCIDLFEFGYTPVQLACEAEHLGILHYLHSHFQDMYPPLELDLHYIDIISGENCALIAVRTGNLPLMKVLFEKVEADFCVRNKRGQGALQIMAEASKVNQMKSYFACCAYLVDVVKVDITYMYEITLLMLQDDKIVSFIENKLREIGIQASKDDLEAQVTLIQNSNSSQILEFESVYNKECTSKDFGLELFKSDSEISIIFPTERETSV